jgi:butyrate kinase
LRGNDKKQEVHLMSPKLFRILAINFGSTSSKIGLYEDDTERYRVNTEHPREEIDRYRSAADQKPMRLEALMSFLREAGVEIGDLSAIAARGGATPRLEAGAYRVNEAMVKRLIYNPVADHAANLCAVIAYELADPLGIPVYIYDSGTMDQMEDIARISGLPDIARKSMGHMENMRAVAMETARRLGQPYEDLNLIVAHLGGGITMSLHQKGRMVDIISDDGGTFSPERAGCLPSIDLIRLCFSGRYDQQEMVKRIRGKGGLVAHLGTANALEVQRMIESGDGKAELIYSAMAYQIAKSIGALAAAADGKVDRIILTGGIAHSEMFTGWVSKRIAFIAPVEIVPGEREVEHLALGILRVLRREENVHEYTD